MRIVRLVRTLVLLFVTVSVTQSDAWAKEGWVRASTDDVLILSDASPKVVGDFAMKYGVFRQAFAEMLVPAGRRPPPITLILFQDTEGLATYLAKSGETGDTLAARIEVDGTAVVALAESSKRDDALALAYEFDTRWSLRRTGYVFPLWLTQGTGSVMASLRLKKGEYVIDGKPNRVEAAWRAERALPWNRFFEIDRQSAEYSGGAASGIYRGQAWAVMNQVLLQESKPREQFEKLAKMIQDRHDPQRALEEVLGVPAGNLDSRFGKQIRNGRNIAFPYDEAAIRSRLKIEPADITEVLVRLSDLLFAHGREDEGNQFLDKAASLSPGAVCVNEALARRALSHQDQSEAARYYRAALVAGSVNPVAMLLSATERLDQAQSFGSDVAGGGGNGTLVALDEIQRALQLDPSDFNAWRLLGRAYFVAGKVSAEGPDELSPGINDEPSGLQVRYYRGMLYSRLGKTTEALADFDYIVAHPHTAPALFKSATVFKIQVQFIEDKISVEKLLADGRYEDAHGVLDRGFERAAGTSCATSYDELLAWVKENEAWLKAVKLYQQKDWAGSLAAVKVFKKTYPQSTLISEARQMAAGAEDQLKRALPTKPD